MNLVNVPITKAGVPIEVDLDRLPTEVYKAALAEGIKALLNAGNAKIKTKDLEGEELDKAKTAAFELAGKKLEDLYSGKVKRAKTTVKVSGVLNTEAMRIARNMVKDALKAQGYKVSYYPAAEITVAAKALIESDPNILEMAKANLEARDKAVAAVGDTLTNIVKGAKQSDKLIKAAEDKKAKEAANKPLSAKQAGKTVKHKAKPGTQPTA